MKKKRPFYLNLRMRLVIYVTVELVAVILIYALLTELLKGVWHIQLQVPTVIQVLVLGIVIGAISSFFLGRWFFDPLVTLGNAMRQVAEGDFETRLDDSKVRFSEIRKIYADFNLMTKELQATEILQTDFVSNVSHEFKTPINAIEGYATLLRDSLNEDVAEAQYAEKILFNTSRLSHLVGNILLLSKVDNQAIRTNLTKYRLDEQIRQSIVLLEPIWSAKDIVLDVDLDVVEYTGNESLMLHVWNNLIGNALKFSPQNGEVRMKLLKKDDTVVFSVEDEGPGIAEGEWKHIFDKFYQGDTSHKEEGNGLGLALVKQILKVARGEISVENLEDTGCRFSVTLKK